MWQAYGCQKRKVWTFSWVFRLSGMQKYSGRRVEGHSGSNKPADHTARGQMQDMRWQDGS